METVYILQVVTICITAVTFIVNVLVTLLTSRQDNYNKVITKSRLDFLFYNRDNASKFAAEAKNVSFLLKQHAENIDLKPLYLSFQQISMALKPYNTIDKKILDAGNEIVQSIEQSVAAKKWDERLDGSVKNFVLLFNIYDDADWKFIKQQFNSTQKNSADFDQLCDEIMAKYQ